MKDTTILRKIFSSLLPILILILFSQVSLSAQCALNQAEVCGGDQGPFSFTVFDVDGSSCLANNNNSAGYVILNISTPGLLSLNINGDLTEGFIDVAIFNIPDGVSPCDAAGDNANQISCNFAVFPSGCASFNDPSCPSNLVDANLTLSAGDRIIIIAENFSGSASNFDIILNPDPGSAQAGIPITNIVDGSVFDIDEPAVVPQGTGNSGGGVYTASCGDCIDATTGVFNPEGLLGDYNITYTQYTVGDLCFSEDISTLTVAFAPPSLTCPDNVIVSSSLADCSAPATWTSPTLIGSNSPELDSTHVSGDIFPLGMTTVTYTATNSVGTDMCSFTVTVNEGAPVLLCRQPIVTCAAPGQCGNDIITLPPFLISEDCGSADITRDGPDSFFPVGTTVLTWSAINQSNNVGTCSQTVIVTDEEAPIVSSCSTETVFDYNTDCMAQVVIDVQGTDACGIASVVGNGTFSYPIGEQVIHPVTITDVNGLVTVHNVTVNVHDEHAPVAENCPESITAQQGSSIPNLVPTFTDNCEIHELSSDVPSEFPLGTTTVTYTAFDYYGNRGECIFDVTITEQSIFMDAMAGRIEACVEEEELSADVRWNKPSVSTVCEYCPTTEYENYIFIGEFYGHQYFLYKGEEALTQEEAATAAMQELNGHLVTINDGQENTYLSRHIPFGTTPISTGLNVSTDEEEGMLYTWSNDDIFNYSNLVIDENINILEDQIVTFNTDGTWTLLPANTTTTFLVERPCVDLRQTGPFIQIENENEELETVLLKSGDLFPIGEYTVTYEAENLCGDVFTRTFDIRVDEPQATYCTTGGGDAALFIEAISIGDMTNTLSEDETQMGYHDYSENPINLNTVITLEEEEIMPLSIPINLTAGGAAANETVYWSVWSDLNRDGDFFDANELILQTSDNQPIEAQLPLDLFGEEAVALRASVSRYAYPEVCADYFSGETEDYSLFLSNREEEADFRYDNDENIDASIVLTDENTGLSPNPASTHILISIPKLKTESTIIFIDAEGKLISQNKLEAFTEQHRIDIADLPEGIYFAEITNGEYLVRKKVLKVK
jgi:hypothetical protein